MPITSIRFSTSRSRPKPKVGDQKEIGGVLHQRCLSKAYDWRGDPIGLDCTGGRQRYRWIPVDKIGTPWH